MLTFVKLGGSLITDKLVENHFRDDVTMRLAGEISTALHVNADLRLLVGHGSGSFGHVAAKRYRTMEGVETPDEWRGFAYVATVAAQLSQLVASVFQSASVPVWRIQPSASVQSRDGAIISMALAPIETALAHDIVPLVHGDVALDETRGGTIVSTETIFFYLAQHLPVQQILLLGEVDGVYDADGHTVPEITPTNYDSIADALGGSAGVDVTGGMETKVRDMLALVQALPHLTIRIMNGTTPGALLDALVGQAQPGTLIRAAHPNVET